MTRGRGFIVGVLIISLVATALARQWAASRRLKALESVHAVQARGDAKLASMDSFALALLLGGLRGPLVLILWTSSETQKGERQLEGFDTKVEWIRMLQPEFDSVHIFQVWNKAYNISVQMASLANKYITILDAIEYARRAERERPNNINLLETAARTYFDKLGNSQEKEYYRRRIREDTMFRPQEQVRRDEQNFRRLKHEPMLDQEGNLLPQFREEFKYLVPYEPFPQGLSVFAIAYNYYVRARIQQEEFKQTHVQLSDLVISSRPGASLKAWAEEEWERGRKFEMQAFAIDVPDERLDYEMASAPIRLNQTILNPNAVSNAIYCHELAARLAADGAKAYAEHLLKYSSALMNYDSQVDHLEMMAAMNRADAAYLRAMRSISTAPVEKRREMLQSALEAYSETINRASYVLLRYWVDEDVAAKIFPPGVTRGTLGNVPPKQYFEFATRFSRLAQRDKTVDRHPDETKEYFSYISRGLVRAQELEAALDEAGEATTNPTP